MKGYSLALTLTLPATIACPLFAPDIILTILGLKWMAVVPIFRLLASTILVFAIANPLSWLFCFQGLVKRLLKMGLVIAPIMVAGYFIGLPRGPKVVAFAYSVLMVAWLIPLIVWALHGTVISPGNISRTAAFHYRAKALLPGSYSQPEEAVYG